MNEEKQLAQDFTTGPVRRQLLVFALPIILANLLQTVYSLVDMVIVGHFVGASGLSAVGIGANVSTIFLVIGQGIAGAGQTLIGQQIGAKDRKGLNRSIGTLFTLLIIAGVIFGAVCVLFCRPILHLMNTPDESFSQAVGYTLICGFGTLFIYGYNAVSSILRGMGESRIPLIIIGVAAGLNLVMDLIFVAGFGMGAAGAALATVLAQGISFAVAIRWLYTHRESFGFDFRPASFVPDGQRLKVLLQISVPYVINGLMITVTMAFINSRVNSYGLTASAVDSIGLKLNNMLYIVSGAISMAAGAMVAQCFGARNFDRMRSVHNNSAAICYLIFVLVSIPLILFPQAIFSLFTTDAEVLAMAPTYMKIVIVFFFASTSMGPPYCIIEGIGYASLGLVISIMDGVVTRVGLSLLLEHFFGLNGLWLGNAAAGLTTTILSGIYYLSGRWKNRKVLVEKEPGL